MLRAEPSLRAQVPLTPLMSAWRERDLSIPKPKACPRGSCAFGGGGGAQRGDDRGTPVLLALCLQMGSYYLYPINPDVKGSSLLHPRLKPLTESSRKQSFLGTWPVGTQRGRWETGYSTADQVTRTAVGTLLLARGNFHWSHTHFPVSFCFPPSLSFLRPPPPPPLLRSPSQGTKQYLFCPTQGS